MSPEQAALPSPPVNGWNPARLAPAQVCTVQVMPASEKSASACRCARADSGSSRYLCLSGACSSRSAVASMGHGSTAWRTAVAVAAPMNTAVRMRARSVRAQHCPDQVRAGLGQCPPQLVGQLLRRRRPGGRHAHAGSQRHESRSARLGRATARPARRPWVGRQGHPGTCQPCAICSACVASICGAPSRGATRRRPHGAFQQFHSRPRCRLDGGTFCGSHDDGLLSVPDRPAGVWPARRPGDRRSWNSVPHAGAFGCCAATGRVSCPVAL